jgi:hypothetical protein
MNFRYLNPPFDCCLDTHAVVEAGVRIPVGDSLIIGLTAIAVQLWRLFGGERDWADPSPPTPERSSPAVIYPTRCRSDRDAVSTERSEVHVEAVRTEGTSFVAQQSMGWTLLR